MQVEPPIDPAHSLEVAAAACALHPAPGQVIERQNDGRSARLAHNRLLRLVRAVALTGDPAVRFGEQPALGIRTQKIRAGRFVEVPDGGVQTLPVARFGFHPRGNVNNVGCHSRGALVP